MVYIWVCLRLQPREGFYIWKMHIVKGEEGLGIQVTGGRGSKRCLLGVIITHVEEGGDIHRSVPVKSRKKSNAFIYVFTSGLKDGIQASRFVNISGMAAFVLVTSC